MRRESAFVIGLQAWKLQIHPFRVLVIGAGLGGLACAISCLKEGLEVTVLEKAKGISEIGAGIQMPPNATRIMAHFGLLRDIEVAGAVKVPGQRLLDYQTGQTLAAKPGVEWQKEQFGEYWYVIHRADYHKVLLDEAERKGAKLYVGCDVSGVETNLVSAVAALSDGRSFTADVIIGADGLRSSIRTTVLGYELSPVATGDMAFRITIPREKVEALNDPFWNGVIEDPAPRIWIGPESHAIVYPVRHKQIWNVVLIRPDDLEQDCLTAVADVAEMRAAFEGWDSKLLGILTCVETCLKWKIFHMSELDTWTKANIALMGDACHPTLPYQAQGAAMAVEDGAVLGILLGSLSREGRKDQIPAVLKLYESLRKSRTTVSVKGAIDMANLFQMKDGPEQMRRNEELRTADLNDLNSLCRWQWASLRYQKNLLGFDTIGDAVMQYEEWKRKLI